MMNLAKIDKMKVLRLNEEQPPVQQPAPLRLLEAPPLRTNFKAERRPEVSSSAAYGAHLLRALKRGATNVGLTTALIGALGVGFVPQVSAQHRAHLHADGYSDTTSQEPVFFQVVSEPEGESSLSAGGMFSYFAGAYGLYIAASALGVGFPRREQPAGDRPTGRVRACVPTESDVLYEKAAPVAAWDASVDQLIADLQATQKNSFMLAGLAAPQIGDGRRVVVIGPGFALVNPEIIDRSGLMPSLEQCKSRSWYTTMKVRSFSVTVRSMEPDGSERVDVLRGFPAVVAQHEIDHLDGKTIWQRPVWWSLRCPFASTPPNRQSGSPTRWLPTRRRSR